MPIRRIPLVVSLAVAFMSVALPAGAAADVPHLVRPGETLTSVARTDGLSIAALASANGISPNSELIIGQILQIPALTPATAARPATAVKEARSTAAQHVVSGSRGTTSGVGASRTTSTGSRTTSTVRSTAATTAAPQAAVSSNDVPLPTPQYVSATEIGEIASADGVPPALAEGIAWQESGWNNDVVSGIGAVGVMQIVPSTWTWIDQYLTPSDPLEPASASENIRAGVLLLHDLLGLTGNNYTLAVASYYQGLASVRAHGLYPATKQYVADVLALAQRFGG